MPSKWDQTAPSATPPPPPLSSSSITSKFDPAEAAAQAAAIAAKIAAQFAAGAMDGSAEHQFAKDIDINDVRNRYMLTRGSTQQQIHEESGGANVSTKGVWYPDRRKATEKDPPLYLHITAPSAEVLNKAMDIIHEYMNLDLGSLVDDRKTKEKRKWPAEKIPVGLDSIRNFNVRAKVVGPSGSFVKYIQQETGARVQIKGVGSGFIDQETGKESDETLYIHLTAPEDGQVARAKVLTDDLLLVVRSEHAKQLAVIQKEQAELHQAQMQYAAYSAMGYAASGAVAPPGSAPPPPPDQPPPPPGEGPQAGGQPSTAEQDPAAACAAYWAAYGYDVNSPEFKEWAVQQYPQYYNHQVDGMLQSGQAAGVPQTSSGAPQPHGPPPPAPPA